MIRKMFREPLIHFLLAGFMLFLFYRSCGITLGDDNSIVVNKKQLLNMLQFQSKAFNEEVFESKLSDMPEVERQQLIDQYIQDEVLYNEALKLGLNQNDYVLKRRIIQKMEFILNDFDDTELDISEDSLEAYYHRYQERYFRPAHYTFTHIFFNNDVEDNGLQRAESFMRLNSHQQLSASEGLQHGDRFLYHRNYTERSASFLESQFGTPFAQALSQMQANQDLWQGPIISEHGYHWIKLLNATNAQIPSMSEIKNTVQSDFINTLKEQHKKKRIQRLIDQYDVKIEI